MRILVDLQGAQAHNCRGIGRYTLNFARNLVKYSKDHEYLFMVSSLFPENLEVVCEAIEEVTDRHDLFVFPEGPEVENAHALGRRIQDFKCDLVRKANCDVLYYPTFFDGFYDRRINTDVPERSSALNIATLYDLIPFHNLDRYPSEFVDFYVQKTIDIMKMDGIFCISRHTSDEIKYMLGVQGENVFFVGADTSECFQRTQIHASEKRIILKKYNINRAFFTYVSAISMHKNHNRLLLAFSQIDPQIRSRYQLALVGPFTQQHLVDIEAVKRQLGLDQDVVTIPFPTDAELNAVYNISSGTIFPSLQEGFGLPVLESMRCGKPVLASGIPSIREILERDDCLFDPQSVSDMTKAMTRFFVDDDWRRDLAVYNTDRAQFFSWNDVIGRVVAGFETVRDQRVDMHSSSSTRAYPFRSDTY